MSVVDVTDSNVGTRSVAAGPTRKVAWVDRATGEARADGGALVRVLSAEAAVELPEGGRQRVRYFILVDLSAVDRARSWRRFAIIAGIAVAVVAALVLLARDLVRRSAEHAVSREATFV